MATIINIHKPACWQKGDAVRINSIADIPDFLKDTITIKGNQIHLVCVEGNETAPLGSVIGYEESTSTSTGWNTWHIANASINLVEFDGVFYKKATVMPAMAVSEEFPEFLKGANITHNEDGSWSIKTDRGFYTAFPGDGYWVKYGTKEDGTPDADILKKTYMSYTDYIVCDEDGQDLGPLWEIDP